MALFGTSRSPLQRLLQQQWKSDDEKTQLLDALREDSGVRAGDVIPLLWITDNTVRNAAATIFASRADAKAVTTLLGELQGQHTAARAFAVRVIGKVRPEAVGPGIEALLKDASAMRKRLGWEVALELGGSARFEYAERAIREASGPIRVAALQRLAAERGVAPIAPLLLTLVADPEDRLRERVIELLSQMPPTSELLDVMLERFAIDNATVRSHALSSIRAASTAMPREVRPRLLKMLSEGEDAIRRTAVELLLGTGSGDEVIAEILQHCRTLLGWLRTRILNTLRTFGDEVLRPAVEMLGHPDEDIRMQALVLCEHFEDPRLVGPVVKLLDDEDWWLRITACETLAKLKDERVTPHLVKALEDRDTRWAAIDALGVIGGEQALRALVGLLNDDRMEVRMEVLQACARSTDSRLLKLFRKVVETDPSQEVRMRAAEILRAKGDTGVGLDAATSTVLSGNLDRPLDRLLADARERGASDVHLTVGEPPWFRLNGQIHRIEHESLTREATRAWVTEILDPVRRAAFEEAGEIDFCHAIPGVGRYRANAFVQRLGTCASFRCIPNLPPTFADLRIPGQLTQLLDYHQGIILVTGPAGGGKSTTLASIINLVNESKSDHIITLEDPIEFVHPSKQSLVNQREVGRNTESFSRALRAALREDPDVIMVGEMRDIETIRMSLMAAETGHLVIATMHTTNCVATIDRLIESFPPDEQQQVRMGLSESLKFVVSQSLVPRADGKGRVAVFEVLKGSMNVSTLIRDAKTFQLPSLMQISRAQGMQTLDQSLADLLDAGLISAETAYMRAENKEQFAAHLVEATS